MNRKQGEVRETSARYQVALAEAADVPKGYKRTELGVIPADWKVGELQRYHPFITSGSRGWARYYSEDGDLFIRITNLSRSSIYLDLSNNRYVRLPCGINSEGLRTQLENGDLLISITADIGIVGYIDKSVPKPAYINQHISLVRFTVNDVDTLYLAYFLASEQSQRKFKASTDQGAKAGLNLEGVGKIVAAFPAMEEQHAIATALSDVDALIAVLDKLIAKKRAIKTAAMQQLLTGKQRLPGFTGEWEVKRLGEVANLHRESLAPASSPATMFTHYSLPAFDGGKQAVLEVGEAIGSNKFIVPNEAILVSKLNPRIPRVWMPEDVGQNAVSSTEFLVLTSKGDLFREFLFVICSSEKFGEAMELLATGTTGSHQRISPKDVLNIQIKLPISKKEQTAIAQILSDMDAEITALEKRRAKTRDIKQGMMQELLTGRTRLV